jgi:hypothetical protein
LAGWDWCKVKGLLGLSVFFKLVPSFDDIRHHFKSGINPFFLTIKIMGNAAERLEIALKMGQE